MSNNNSENSALKIIERIQSELREVELMCSQHIIKEKLHKLLDYIDTEIGDNRIILADKIYTKVKETKHISPELNTNFYLLYRNLVNDKITIQEAQNIYDMYVKELIVTKRF